jgi:hypothetical protein
METELSNREVDLDKPLTNRGFLLGCALIAEAIDWAKFKDGMDISEVEGLTFGFQRVRKVFCDESE